MPDLREKVTRPLEACLGHELREAWYHCLAGESDGTDLDDPALYIGGEVHLFFGEGKALVITWDENAGWECHFSLVVADVSQFKLGALHPWRATALPPWSEAIGSRLLSASVYGFSEKPHLVCLSFSNEAAIFVGCGRNKKFGEGDDILVRSSENMTDISHWDVLWSGPTVQ